MKLISHSMLVAAATTCAAVIGCANENKPEAKVVTTSATRVDNTYAIQAISSARCDREMRCDNIGKDRTFSSREACISDVKESAREAVGADQCPKGVLQADLTSCLSAIKSDGCGNILDHVTRMAACRPSEICGH